jgi:hypothetical protein
MNRIFEPRLIRIVRVVGGLYALTCCWLPMIWLAQDQLARYGFHQHRFLAMRSWDQVALLLLALLGLLGTIVVLRGDRRISLNDSSA